MLFGKALNGFSRPVILYFIRWQDIHLFQSPFSIQRSVHPHQHNRSNPRYHTPAACRCLKLFGSNICAICLFPCFCHSFYLPELQAVREMRNLSAHLSQTTHWCILIQIKVCPGILLLFMATVPCNGNICIAVNNSHGLVFPVIVLPSVQCFRRYCGNSAAFAVVLFPCQSDPCWNAERRNRWHLLPGFLGRFFFPSIFPLLLCLQVRSEPSLQKTEVSLSVRATVNIVPLNTVRLLLLSANGDSEKQPRWPFKRKQKWFRQCREGWSVIPDHSRLLSAAFYGGEQHRPPPMSYNSYRFLIIFFYHGSNGNSCWLIFQSARGSEGTARCCLCFRNLCRLCRCLRNCGCFCGFCRSPCRRSVLLSGVCVGSASGVGSPPSSWGIAGILPQLSDEAAGYHFLLPEQRKERFLGSHGSSQELQITVFLIMSSHLCRTYLPISVNNVLGRCQSKKSHRPSGEAPGYWCWFLAHIRIHIRL